MPEPARRPKPADCGSRSGAPVSASPSPNSLQHERTQVRTRVVCNDAQQKREEIPRFLGRYDGVDESAGGRAAGVEVMLIIDAHRVDRPLGVGIHITPLHASLL